MSKKELRDVWTKAVENLENEDINNYFYDREITVNGVTFKFNLDADASRDTMDNDIYYSANYGTVDDLVYAKKHPNGNDSAKEVLSNYGEFEERVKELANSINERV